MIIQTPESFFQKKYDAEERVGKYLLALVTFRNGLAFGSKFNERQSKPGQWLMKISSTSIIGGVGDLRDFKSVMLSLDDFCQNISVMLGEHYLTGEGAVSFTTSLLKKTFEERANALSVNLLIADWRNDGKAFLWFVDFDGSILQLKNFAVAGGYEYSRPLSREELEKLSAQEKAFFDLKRAKLEKEGFLATESSLIPCKIRRPKKEAIAYLEKNWKPKMKKEEAIDALKKTLFECNPDSRDKTIEIIAIEYGKCPEFLCFKKNGQKNKTGK